MAKILVTDDSETIRKLLDITLRGVGHAVTLAADGNEALAKFRDGAFDLVITDINMPKMNGIELIRAIRQENANVPILVLTSETEEALRQQGTEAGANGW
ncbi:MAG: response regulator, partial [Leptospiraceae bacterium]|nr:response regulator [Leptospiraceae bacterium]